MSPESSRLELSLRSSSRIIWRALINLPLSQKYSLISTFSSRKTKTSVQSWLFSGQNTIAASSYLQWLLGINLDHSANVSPVLEDFFSATDWIEFNELCTFRPWIDEKATICGSTRERKMWSAWKRASMSDLILFMKKCSFALSVLKHK